MDAGCLGRTNESSQEAQSSSTLEFHSDRVASFEPQHSPPSLLATLRCSKLQHLRLAELQDHGRVMLNLALVLRFNGIHRAQSIHGDSTCELQSSFLPFPSSLRLLPWCERAHSTPLLLSSATTSSLWTMLLWRSLRSSLSLV